MTSEAYSYGWRDPRDTRKPHIRFNYFPCRYGGGYWRAWIVVRIGGMHGSKAHFGLTPEEAMRNLVAWHWGPTALAA